MIGKSRLLNLFITITVHKQVEMAHNTEITRKLASKWRIMPL